MRFTETPLAGAYLIEFNPRQDERGAFTRSYDERFFADHGLNSHWPQENVSSNTHEGTLRGMHMNVPEAWEIKTVRPTRGSVYDVIVDMRPNSPTRFGWHGVELSAGDGAMLYIPEGFAHGFITLKPGTEVVYRMGSPYRPDAAVGFRWNDPLIGIAWPTEPVVISERDRTYPDLDGRLEAFS